MTVSQKEVNETLKYIKEKYPRSNDNGLQSHILARSDSPLAYMNDARFLDDVQRSQKWVRWAKGFGLRKTINKTRTSYTIKHYIEESEISKGYVPNMAAIVAFIIEGVNITSNGNPYTNLSMKCFVKYKREDLLWAIT